MLKTREEQKPGVRATKDFGSEGRKAKFKACVCRSVDEVRYPCRELCIGRVAHATRGTCRRGNRGGGLKGQKIVFWRSERERTKKKFRGWGKQRPKEVLLDVLSMGGLIDQMGLRIRISKSYQESQLNLQPGALVISE